MNRILLFIAFICCLACEEATNSYPDFPSNKKVLIIGIDGARSDAFQPDIAPFINDLITNQNVMYNLQHKTERQSTVSGPNWSSICTGVHVDKHQVTENFFENNNLKKHPHFFNHLNDYYGDEHINLASVAAWFPINYFMTIHEADYGPVVFDYTDDIVFEESLNLLNNNPINPDVLFIHLDQLDHAGHASGFRTTNPEYAEAINNVDNYVMQLFEATQKRKDSLGENWLTIIVSDHGGEGQDHSDINNPAINQTILFLHNQNISENASLTVSEQVDIVPTVLNFLEMDISNLDLDGKNLLP